MSIKHVYSQTVADGTATSIVRPSDWNSNHNLIQNLGGNTAGTSQVSGQDIVWAGGSNITLSANGSTVSVNAPGASSLVAGANITLSSAGSTISIIGGAGGGGATMSDWQPYAMAASSNTSIGAQSVFFCPLLPPNNVTMSAVEQVWSNALSSTSTPAWSKSMSFSYGLYSEHPSATAISLIASSSVGLSASGSSNLSIGFTYGAGASTVTFSSAASAHSFWNANKLMTLPFAGSMSAGGLYFWAQNMNTASAGANVAATWSQMLNNENSVTNFVGFGTGTINASNKSAIQEPYGFIRSVTSGGLPVSMAYSDASAYSNYQPFLYFEA